MWEKCAQVFKFLMAVCMQISLLNAQGFVAGTLVKIPSGYLPIEQITKDDLVIAYRNNEYVERRVTHTIRNKNSCFYHIVVDGAFIDVAPDQKLYISEKNEWIDAKGILSGQAISTNRKLRCVDQIIRVDEEVEMFDFIVEIDHNFCVTHHDIVVHNFAPVFIGLSFLIEACAIEFAGISLATAIAGIGAGIIVSNHDSKKKVELKLSQDPADIKAGGGAPNDPN
jgi:hypothetical protein